MCRSVINNGSCDIAHDGDEQFKTICHIKLFEVPYSSKVKSLNVRHLMSFVSLLKSDKPMQYTGYS